jgi:hypothetical protein
MMKKRRLAIPTLVSTLAIVLAGSTLGVAGATDDPIVSIQAAPQIDSISPGFGRAGDVIEITGRGFRNGGLPPTVTFLSLYQGEVDGWNDSRITVIVPVVPNPPDGFIELRVTTSAGSDVGPFRYYSDGPSPSPTTPGAPQGLKAVAKKGKVLLSWRAPASGASSVTSYQWMISVKGTDRWSKWKTVRGGANGLKQTAKRIRPRTAYLVEVRAMAGTQAGPAAQVEFRGK